MRKLMSVMLGLSLITGAAAVAFGQDTKGDQTNKKNAKKKKKKKDTATNKRA
ncbi:MAG TPA: hypothetical protein VEV85_16015 [Bryobacteraceae bacterium]|nr:hypothetical protein [Bryobacteraceae bacterium]